jgi:protein TonB
VIFETPPAPQAETIPEPQPAPPTEAMVIPEPEAVTPPEPEPPPPEPQPRHVVAKPAPAVAAAPQSAAPPTIDAPVASAAPQVAALPIIPPQPIAGRAGNPKPDYPAEARRRGLQGKVVLLVEVSAAGLPANVAVAASSGHAALDQAALAAVQLWRFSPATRGGTPMAGTAQVPIQFRLEE